MDFVDYTNADETALLSFEGWGPGMPWEVSRGKAVVTGELTVYPAPPAASEVGATVPLHQLSVAPADVSGSKLGLALNAPAPTPLAAVRLDHPDGGALILRVLGASHVITVEHAEIVFSEQVSAMSAANCPTVPECRAIVSSPASVVLAGLASLPRGARWNRRLHRQQVATVSRNRLFVVAFALAACSVVCLIFGISLQSKNVRSCIASHCHEYSRDAGGTRYLCTGLRHGYD